VVGIQEAWGNTARLARAVGWKYYDHASTSSHASRFWKLLIARVSTRLSKSCPVKWWPWPTCIFRTTLWAGHGPIGFHGGAGGRKSTEGSPANGRAFVEKLSALAKEGVPVFLTGDFNSPSHLDWTKPTVGVLQNHRYVVEWPVTKFIQEKGLKSHLRGLRLHRGQIQDSRKPYRRRA
jgi:hypothetical protein